MIEPWLTVTSDPAKIEAARKAAAAATAERYERIFRGLGSRQAIDDETIALIDDNRPDSIGRLEDALERSAITDEAVGAMLLLCRLEEAAGRNYASRILREGTAEQRLRVLKGMNRELGDEDRRKKVREFLTADPKFVAATLAQLDDPEKKIRKAAVQCCGTLGTPEVMERFLSQVRKPDARNKKRIMYELSKRPVNEELLDIALELWGDSGPFDFFGAAFFKAAAASKSESIRRKVRGRLRAWLETDDEWADAGNGFLLLAAVANAAEAEDGDWLLRLINLERSFCSEEPLTAYLRLFPDDGRRRLIEGFDYRGGDISAFYAAATSYAGTADGEMIRELTKRIDTVDAEILPALCNALIVIGGKSVRETIERLASRLEPDDLTWCRMKLASPSYEEIAEAFRVSGTLSAAEIDAALRTLSTKRDDTDESDDGLATLFDFFEAAGSTLYFPAESGRLPCRHDAIVGRFARGSRGRFRPEAVLEIRHRCDLDDSDLDDSDPDDSDLDGSDPDNSDPDNREAPPTLQFVVNDRLYRAELRNLGDWYDTVRLVATIHEALAREGIEERFTAIGPGDPVIAMVFADPQWLISLAERFPLRLHTDLGELMRKRLGFGEFMIGQGEERM